MAVRAVEVYREPFSSPYQPSSLEKFNCAIIVAWTRFGFDA
jgi:hypothetical protein